MTESMWGYGGLKFTNNLTSETVTFEKGLGTINYVPVVDKFTNDNGYVFYKTYGWRPEITVKLLNACTDDYLDFQTLTKLVSNCTDNDSTINILPRYTSPGTNLSFTCRLDSEFSYKDISRLEIGQTLELKFKSISIVANPSGFTRAV